MPICSYVVYPHPGREAALIQKLDTTPGCRPVPAENSSLLLLVTDTPDDKSEKRLQKRLKKMRELQCLALVFAHEDPQQTVKEVMRDA